MFCLSCHHVSFETIFNKKKLILINQFSFKQKAIEEYHEIFSINERKKWTFEIDFTGIILYRFCLF
jgi:hypothetical protein